MNKLTFPYYGGKSNLLFYLLPLVPPHHCFVEAFGGGATLILNKAQSEVEVYNDIDSGLVNMFRVLRDVSKFETLQKLLFLTPYSREEWKFCSANYRSSDIDDVEKARRFIMGTIQALNYRIGGGWGWSKVKNEAQTWRNFIEKALPRISKRFQIIQIEHSDFRVLIKNWDSENTFFYLDPPYLLTERNRTCNYSNEMSIGDHNDLLELCLNAKAKILISGYPNSLYNDKLKDWKTKEIKQRIFSGMNLPGDSKSEKIEKLWWNYKLENCEQLDLFKEE